MLGTRARHHFELKDMLCLVTFYMYIRINSNLLQFHCVHLVMQNAFMQKNTTLKLSDNPALRMSFVPGPLCPLDIYVCGRIIQSVLPMEQIKHWKKVSPLFLMLNLVCTSQKAFEKNNFITFN